MKSKTAKSIAKDIIIVVVGVAAIWIGLQMYFGTANPFYVVSSGSMIPVLEVYDVLVVDGKVPFEDIGVSDIIVFYKPGGEDRVIVHRVVAILSEDPKAVRTKGDANPISIPGTDYPITDKEYIGKVAHVIPQIGYVTQVLRPPINYIIIAVIVGIMIVRQYTAKSKKPKFGADLPQKTDERFENVHDAEYEKIDTNDSPAKTADASSGKIQSDNATQDKKENDG
ncbi:MAG: signal peptidase I [Candidatus Nitrosotenuis sp.]